MKTTLHLPQPLPPLVMAEGVVYKQAPGWYGADNMPLRLNIIRRKDDIPRPTILWITGGGWQNVSKNAHVPAMVYLAEAGFTLVTAEYRTTAECPHPGQLYDIKAAVRYLRANASRWNIDPDHIGIMGESAGGHLSAMMGVTSGDPQFDEGDNLNYSSAVQAVCPWYPPTDFTAPEFLATDAFSLLVMLIGGDPRTHIEEAKAASPAYQVKPDNPPFLIIHGTGDTLVPFSQSEILYEKLVSAGVPADLLAIEGAGHGDDRLFCSPEVKDAILAFFRRHLM